MRYGAVTDYAVCSRARGLFPTPGTALRIALAVYYCLVGVRIPLWYPCLVLRRTLEYVFVAMRDLLHAAMIVPGVFLDNVAAYDDGLLFLTTYHFKLSYTHAFQTLPSKRTTPFGGEPS